MWDLKVSTTLPVMLKKGNMQNSQKVFFKTIYINWKIVRNCFPFLNQLKNDVQFYILNQPAGLLAWAKGRVKLIKALE